MFKDRMVTVLDGDIRTGAWGLQPGRAMLRRGWFGLDSIDLRSLGCRLIQRRGSIVTSQSPRTRQVDWGTVELEAELDDGRRFTLTCNWDAARDLMATLG